MTCVQNNVFANANNDVAGFRHSASNAAASTAYVTGVVNASVKDGNVEFKNDRYDAVVAYIHDKSGNVIDKFIIPGATDSYFTAAASAVKDTLPALWSGQGFKPLSDYFEKGSAMVINSGIPASKIPEGGAISYVSGTPDAILATVASGIIKSFTTVVSAATPKGVPDTILGKVSRSVFDKAMTDPELLVKASKLLAEDKPSELGKLVLDWVTEKGRTAAMSSMLEQGFEPDAQRVNKLLDVAIKPLETVSNSLVSASNFRDAWLANRSGPRVLWYDMPYNSNNQLADQYKFNWIDTPLASHDEVTFSAFENELDGSTKFWNPTTWGNQFEAEYKRYSFTPIETHNTTSNCATSPQSYICSPVLSNVITSITQGDNSHFGAANLYAGWNTSTDANSPQNAVTNPTNNNNANLPTGAEQSAQVINTQAFKSSDWKVVEGDPAKHYSFGNNFGSITAPNGGAIAALNNANMVQTVMQKTVEIPAGVKQVTVGMMANFVTNEFPKFVGSQYNDKALVEIKTGSGNVYQATLYNKELNSSNFQVVSNLPSPMSATGGQTGFEPISKTIPIANGGNLSITVKTINVGDTAYPSATLINSTNVK